MTKHLYILSCVLFLNTAPLFAQKTDQNSLVANEPSSSPLMMMPWGREGGIGSDADRRGNHDQRRPFLQDDQNSDNDDEEQGVNVELGGGPPIADGSEENAVGTQLNEQDRQLIDALKRNRACRTIAGLKAIDVASQKDLAASLWSRITNFMTTSIALKSVLILNDKTNPFYIIIPASGTQERSTLAPIVIPVGFPTYLRDGRPGPAVPRRVPTAQENQQIRKFIKDALDFYYKCDVPEKLAQAEPTLRNFYESLEAPETRDKPLTVTDIQYLFPLLEEDLEAGDVHPELRYPQDLLYIPQAISHLAERSSNHPSVDQLIDFSRTNPTDEQFIVNRQQAFNEIDRRLGSPWQSFGKACWKYAEGMTHQFYLGLPSILLGAISVPLAIPVITFYPTILFLVLFDRVRIPIIKPYVTFGRVKIRNFDCNQDMVFINRSIDVTDHLIGLDMYKDFVELRYRSIAQFLNRSDLTADQLMKFSWPPFSGSGILPSKWLISWTLQEPAYEKALMKEFGFARYPNYENHFIWSYFPFYDCIGNCKEVDLLTEPLDWVYANVAGIGQFSLSDFRKRSANQDVCDYEAGIRKRYIPDHDRVYHLPDALKYNRFQLAEHLQDLTVLDCDHKNYFDSRLHEPMLVTRRNELKQRMRPVIREYYGVDIGKCSQDIHEQYKKAKAEAYELTNEESNNAWFDWMKLNFIVGACIGGSISFFQEMQNARYRRNPLVQKVDRAFYEAARASEVFKEYLGLGMGIHQEIKNSLQQSQRHDEELLNLIRIILMPNAGQNQVLAVGDGNLGQTILDIIAARIRNRADVIRELSRRISNRRRSTLSFTRGTETQDAAHND